MIEIKLYTYMYNDWEIKRYIMPYDNIENLENGKYIFKLFCIETEWLSIIPFIKEWEKCEINNWWKIKRKKFIKKIIKTNWKRNYIIKRDEMFNQQFNTKDIKKLFEWDMRWSIKEWTFLLN